MGHRRTDIKRRRHTPEQIVRKLREADRLLAEGIEVPEVAKALEVSEATYHRWRAQFGGMKADDLKRFEGTRARERSAEADRGGQGAGTSRCGRSRRDG
jgi:transposase